MWPRERQGGKKTFPYIPNSHPGWVPVGKAMARAGPGARLGTIQSPRSRPAERASSTPRLPGLPGILRGGSDLHLLAGLPGSAPRGGRQRSGPPGSAEPMPGGRRAPGPAAAGESGWFRFGFRWGGGGDAQGGPEPLSAEGPVRRVRPSWSFAAVVAAGAGRVRLEGALAAALPRDCLDALPSETHVLLLREEALEAWPAVTGPAALLDGQPVWRRELRAEEAAAAGGRRRRAGEGGGRAPPPSALTRPLVPPPRAAAGARRLRDPPAALLHPAAHHPPGAPAAAGPGARAAAGRRRDALLVGRRQVSPDGRVGGRRRRSGTERPSLSGRHGQLGHGDLESRREPRAVEALQGLAVAAAAAGGWHSAAVSGERGGRGRPLPGRAREEAPPRRRLTSPPPPDAGDLYLWGWNEAGQLGLPSKMSTESGAAAAREEAAQAPPNRPLCQGSDRLDVGAADGPGTDEVPFVSLQPLPALLDLPEEAELRRVSCGSRHTAAVTGKGPSWSGKVGGQRPKGSGPPHQRPSWQTREDARAVPTWAGWGGAHKGRLSSTSPCPLLQPFPCWFPFRHWTSLHLGLG